MPKSGMAFCIEFVILALDLRARVRVYGTYSRAAKNG